MANRIHAAKVPMVEFEFDGKEYKFVYSLATMNYIAQLASEQRLPKSDNIWDLHYIKCLLESTGLAHHPDEDWDALIRDCNSGDLIELSAALSDMINEENIKASGGVPEGEVPTEPTKPRGRPRTKKAE